MMKKPLYLLFAFTCMIHVLNAQNVGIGTTNPAARLHVVDSAVVFSAIGAVPEVAGKTAIEGGGRRMMWHPGKAAFRVGYVSANAWDDSAIGRFSFAAGKDVVVLSTGATALGLDNRVEGYARLALGSNCFTALNYGIAIGANAQSKAASAVAFGNAVTASSLNAFAIGNSSVVNGNSANGFAIGNNINVTGTNGFGVGNGVTASGVFSTAIGNNSAATGPYTVALGRYCGASVESSTAIGNYSTANGQYAVALGTYCAVSGQSSVGIGYDNQISASNAVAIGSANFSTAPWAFAIGNSCRSSGSRSFAMGNFTTASGSNSTSMGNYVSTSNLDGAFAIGDNSTTTVMESFAVNGYRARFAGGYRLFTNSAVSVGAFLNSGANSWAALSDVRMKENFMPVDGEAFLKKIAAMPQFTWNYIGQDVATFRHYGSMAQDFFKAFGKDPLGEIGCDTLINQQDFLGVNFIAIQALEKRSQELAKENETLSSKVSLLEEANKTLAQQVKLLSENVNTALATFKKLSTNGPASKETQVH